MPIPSGFDLEFLMKKIITATLFSTLLLSAAIPSFAQNRRIKLSEPTDRIRKPVRVPKMKGDFVQFETVEAVSNGGGTLVQWQMASETGNLGFEVFRLGSNGIEKVDRKSVV